VARVLEILRGGFEMAMKLSGRRTLAEIDRSSSTGSTITPICPSVSCIVNLRAVFHCGSLTLSTRLTRLIPAALMARSIGIGRQKEGWKLASLVRAALGLPNDLPDRIRELGVATRKRLSGFLMAMRICPFQHLAT